MGTRADFYRGGTDPATMQWIGSIGWDGYPDGISGPILEANSEQEYLDAVVLFLDREDATQPEQGWPWPWPDSGTTDYAYTWTAEGVRVSAFGSQWFHWRDKEPSAHGVVAFPDMSGVQNVAWDNRSGLVVLRVEEEPDGS